jgi:hypothetical protein
MGYILSADNQLFQPDTILPSQFFAAMRKKVPQEAEYRLMVAVLEDAIDCFQKHCNARDAKARQLFEDAERWVASDDRNWPFSFINICDLLGLNPSYVREGLNLWKERRSASPGRPKVIALKPKGPTKIGVRRAVGEKAS